LSTRLSAVDTPESVVSEPSVMATAPAELNVSDPKFIAVAAVVVLRSIDVPENEALLVTARSALASLVSAPPELSTRLSAVDTPVSVVPSASVMLTAPAELKVSVPKA
jgi:hypothetical protein